MSSIPREPTYEFVNHVYPQYGEPVRVADDFYNSRIITKIALAALLVLATTGVGFCIGGFVGAGIGAAVGVSLLAAGIGLVALHDFIWPNVDADILDWAPEMETGAPPLGKNVKNDMLIENSGPDSLKMKLEMMRSAEKSILFSPC